jgi:hypothetical protein
MNKFLFLMLLSIQKNLDGLCALLGLLYCIAAAHLYDFYMTYSYLIKIGKNVFFLTIFSVMVWHYDFM